MNTASLPPVKPVLKASYNTPSHAVVSLQTWARKHSCGCYNLFHWKNQHTVVFPNASLYITISDDNTLLSPSSILLFLLVHFQSLLTIYLSRAFSTSLSLSPLSPYPLSFSPFLCPSSENGQMMVLWVGQQLPQEFITNVFGVASYSQIDPDMVRGYNMLYLVYRCVACTSMLPFTASVVWYNVLVFAFTST